MEPHANQPVAHAGAPLEGADAVMIMVHGRNASPSDILSLGVAINRPRVACIAPADVTGEAWVGADETREAQLTIVIDHSRLYHAREAHGHHRDL